MQQIFALRSWKSGMARGSFCKCPDCGRGRLYKAYLKPVEYCAVCQTALHHHQADDAPPYFTMMIVGHLVIPAALVVERLYKPEIWMQLAFWLPITTLLMLVLLPMVKGAIIGLQWALRMHGFSTST